MNGTKTLAPSTSAAVVETNGRAVLAPADPADVPNPADYVTEDGKPVDNTYVEMLYPLLTDPLLASWHPPGEANRPFFTSCNVGWFYARRTPPVVPDFLLSLDIVRFDPTTPAGRSYFQWEYGKPPDLVIEVVSDTRGDEAGEKMQLYHRQRLTWYVIHDPFDVLGQGVLRAFVWQPAGYTEIDHRWIAPLELGLTMWQGTYRGLTHSWLRWCDRQGRVLLTGIERAQDAELRIETAEERAESAEERIQRLLAQLRQAGIEPTE